jgi:hypothetical protein
MPRLRAVIIAAVLVVGILFLIFRRLDAQKEFNQLEELDPANFDRPTEIDNSWFPLKPGTKYVYDGQTTEKNETLSHRLEFIVTDLTKEILGVRTLVIWIVDYSEGELVEKEIAFYAQDNDGTVWYFGEHPEEYADGEFIDAPTWIAGLDGARAGIYMHASPEPGTPSYSQGWGPGVGWTDRARVILKGEQTCVPTDCYDNVLVTEEYNREELNAFQQKYYAFDVGNVRVGWDGADVTQETLELVELVQLSPQELAEVRAEAIKLEEHAYEISEDVYGQTSPIEQDLLSE